MNENWKSDPRLKNMDHQKLALLTQFAEDLASAPQAQKTSVFLSLNKQMAAQNLRFSPEETELLFSILTADMTPEEKSRVQMIRKLTSRMHSSRK